MFGIQQDLKKAVARLGLLEQIEAFKICQISQELMFSFCQNKLFCPEVVKYLKSTQTLEIKLKNIIIGQQLRAKTQEILNQINQKMGGFFVEKIRYRMN